MNCNGLKSRQRKRGVLFIGVIIIITLIITFFLRGSAEAYYFQGWDIGGYFKNASAWRVAGDSSGEMLKCENIFELFLKRNFGDITAGLIPCRQLS